MKRSSLLSLPLMLVPAMLGARTVTSPRLGPAAVLSAADSALAAIATVVHHARQTIVSVDGVPRLYEGRVAAARLVGDSIGFGVRIDIGDGILRPEWRGGRMPLSGEVADRVRHARGIPALSGERFHRAAPRAAE